MDVFAIGLQKKLIKNEAEKNNFNDQHQSAVTSSSNKNVNPFQESARINKNSQIMTF